MSKSFEKFNDPSRKKVADSAPPKKIRDTSKLFSKVALFRVGGLFVGLIIYLFIANYVYQTQVIDVKHKQLIQLSQQRVKITAENIQSFLRSVHPKLEFYTRKASLLTEMVNNDQEALARYEDDIAKRIGQKIQLRFTPLGKAAVDLEGVPPIRFSELDMIKRAEKREQVFPEAAKVENSWFVNFVVPIPKDSAQKVVGTMLVSLELKSLEQPLIADNARLGTISLFQQYGSGRPWKLLSVGSATDTTIVAKEKIQNSHFYVEFTPSDSLAVQVHVNYILIGIILLVVAVVVIGIAGFLGARLATANAKGQPIEGETKPVSAKEDVTTSSAMFLKKHDILDVDIVDGDEALLGLDDDVEENTSAESLPQGDAEKPILSVDIADEVFRAYDIRGMAKTQITNEFARKVGQAVASEAMDAGESTLIVARDARLSSPELTEFLIRGILSTGCNVLNIGTVPTPLMYFATEVLDSTRSGVMVTASHNPGDHNGFKIVIDGKCRLEEDIKAIRQRIIEERMYQGAGQEHRHDVIPDYIDTIFSDVALAGDVSIVLDAGNAVPGIVAPRLFEELGCAVTPLFCDLDGKFPNHQPDPSRPENLTALIDKVKEIGADLGVAFDGDGDRLAVVTPKGKIIWPDRLLMLFATDVVSRNPGADVIYDVKSTRHLGSCISEAGGRPIMWKTGHSPMKAKMQETGALLGGEYSGHIFIKDRWYGFDDGLYAAARLIEIISLQGTDLDTIFEGYPESLNTPEIRIPVDEARKFNIIESLLESGDFGNAKITHLDGVRADLPEGWGLVRASNTSAEITMRFEADTEEVMHSLKSLFVREIRKIDNTINIDWEK